MKKAPEPRQDQTVDDSKQAPADGTGTDPDKGPDRQTWNLYIIRCNDGTLYTGITTNLARRIDEHNGCTLGAGKDRGAAYTRARRPVVLVYCEQHPNRSIASRREWQVKRLSRSAKLRLVDAVSITLRPNP